MNAIKFWAFGFGGGGHFLGSRGRGGNGRELGRREEESGGVPRLGAAAGHPLRAAGRWRFTCTDRVEPASGGSAAARSFWWPTGGV